MGCGGRRIKPCTRLYVVPRLRKPGTLHLLHHTSAGCVYLNTNTGLPSGQDQLSGYELLSEGTDVK